MTHLVKATDKGQVTLPAPWRKRFDTNRYVLKENGDSLVITPLAVEALEDGTWETVFDAKRDNGGKGVPIDALIKTLKKTL